MPIRLKTLGGLTAFDADVELEWLGDHRVRAALLVYLAVERTAARSAAAALFWPESDEENARHALRQGLYQLKQHLGDGWIEARTQDLRISDEIRTDVAAFEGALERGDFEAAARRYDGPFLHGIHLADIKPWEMWVDARRAHLAREYRRACRAWVESCRAAGDLAAAIAAAQRWLAPDPLDDEAQHTLIAVLAEAGQRTDALQQYESYLRLLEADGLEPLAETRQLAAQVEAEASPGPSLPYPTPAPPTRRETSRPVVTRPAPRGPRRRTSLTGPLALVFVLIGVGLAALQRLVAVEPEAGASPSVYFVGVANRTQDAQLDGLTVQMDLALRRSARFRLLEAEEVAAALAALARRPEDGEIGTEAAREVAWHTGTPVVVAATLRVEERAYVLSVEVVHVGKRPTDLPRTWTRRFAAPTKTALSDAVDAASRWIGAVLGEAADEISFNGVPLAVIVDEGRGVRRGPPRPPRAGGAW